MENISVFAKKLFADPGHILKDPDSTIYLIWTDPYRDPTVLEIKILLFIRLK